MRIESTYWTLSMVLSHSIYKNFTKVAINWTNTKIDSELTPFIKHMRIQSMTTQTIGSQFPLVPMVNVKGLNSQAITDHIRVFSGIPRSFRMVSMQNKQSYMTIRKFTMASTSKKKSIQLSSHKIIINSCNYCFSIKNSLPKLSVSVWPRKKNFTAFNPNATSFNCR
jgi:hypothetical protein